MTDDASRSLEHGHLAALGLTPVCLLGRGASGVVWRARDGRGRDTAVKLFHADLGEAARERVRREHLVLAGLRHPNVVRVLAYHEQPVPAIVLEYLEGRPLLEALDFGRTPDPDERADPERLERLVGLLLQLLDALEAVHGAGLVHHDVKPANAIVTPAGAVKLLDLGLAASRGAAGTTSGTLRYMAPEVLRGMPSDPRSDVYAAGLIAFEALTGDVPFADRDDAAAFAAARLNAEPPDPRDANPALPVELSRWVRAAIGRRPSDRPPTAAESARLLTGAAGARRRPRPPAHGRAVALVEPPLVGREELLRRLGERADRLLAGERLPALLLEGEEGAGATRLIAEWRGQLQGEVLVLQLDARGFARGEPLAPLAPVLDEITELLAGWEPGDAARAVPVLARALTAITPRACMLPGFDLLPEPEPLPPRESEERLVDVVSRLLAGLAAVRPVVLVLEDAGEASALLLQALDRTLAGEGASVLLVATARPGAPGASRAPLARADRMTLEPLASDALTRLIAGTLGAPPTAELREWLVEESSGLPGRALDALRAAAAIAALVAEGGRVGLDRALRPRLVSASRSRAQLVQLSPDALAVAGAIAVLEAAAGVEEIGEVARLSPARASRGGQELLARGLAVDQAGRLRLRAEALRPALLEVMGGDAQRRLHSRAARAARRRGDAEGAAHHGIEAGLAGRALASLTEAARAALARGDPERAHRFATAGLEGPAPGGAAGAPRPPAREGELRTLRARALVLLGRLGEADRELALAKELLDAGRRRDDAVERDWLRLVQERARIRGGYDEVFQLFTDYLRRAEARGDAGAAAFAHNCLIGACNRSGRPQAAEAHARAAIAWFLAARRHAELAHALNALGLVLRAHGSTEEAVRVLGRARRIASAIGVPALECLSLYNLGGALYMRWRYHEALEVYRQAAALARRTGDQPREALIERNRAAIHLMTGRYAEAAETFARARLLAERTEHRRALAEITAAEGALAVRVGDLAWMPAGFDAALEAQAAVSVDMLPTFLYVRAEARILAGDGAGARADIARARGLVTSFGRSWIEGDAQHLLARLALAAGERGEAERRAREAMAHAERSGDRAVRARSWTLLALATGECAEAEAALAAAVECGEAHVQLEARAALARLLARAGRRAEADAERARALDLVERIAALAGPLEASFRASPLVRRLLAGGGDDVSCG